tara:strand:- start:1953 stop:2117 length:165 start_codon:yes stop_codon:yes gene_type:complete
MIFLDALLIDSLFLRRQLKNKTNIKYWFIEAPKLAKFDKGPGALSRETKIQNIR